MMSTFSRCLPTLAIVNSPGTSIFRQITTRLLWMISMVDIYIEQKNTQKTHLSHAAEANASAADIFARSRFCGWRARAQGSGAITFTRVLFKNQSALFLTQNITGVHNRRGKHWKCNGSRKRAFHGRQRWDLPGEDGEVGSTR